MKERRKPEYPEKNPDDELQKYHFIQSFIAALILLMIVNGGETSYPTTVI